jgi:hypothetical protein
MNKTFCDVYGEEVGIVSYPSIRINNIHTFLDEAKFGTFRGKPFDLCASCQLVFFEGMVAEIKARSE